MIVRIDAVSPVPPYEQLRRQIAGMIRSGTLAPSRQLPPIRQLAADLGIAPGTVARAYRELEADGLLVMRGRRGTRVADPLPRPSAPGDAAQRLLSEAAEQFAVTVGHLDLPIADVIAAVRAALGESEPADQPLETTGR